MTRDQFLDLQPENSATPLPIMLDDGRMGLCSHWTDTDVIADIYVGNYGEQVYIAFDQISDVGGGALSAPASAVRRNI